jgi:DNA-binding response OmpR family regulator
MSVSALREAGDASILVVDDEALILLDLQVSLEGEGFDVTTAGSCEQALALISRQRFDAAILDVNLGRGETCEAVAAALRKEGIPFLLHTGDLDRQGELVSSLGGEVVPKPTPSETFAERIRAMI